jgi:hypothetical protein
MRMHWIAAIAAVLAGAAPAIGQTCGPWTRIGAEPPFGGASLNGVAYGDGLFVAVGDGGLIVTSPDGVAWTRRDSGETANLRGVTCADGRFVAVGDAGTIVISDDGSAWAPVSGPTTSLLDAVTWSGSAFIAVGEAETILVSPDGEGWSAAAGPEPYPAMWTLHGVACGAGTCVAGGSAYESSHQPLGIVLRSDDGATWHSVFAETDFQQTIFDLAWNGQRFVAVGGNVVALRVASSVDGRSWDVTGFSNPGYQGFSAVTSGDGTTIAFGDPGRVATSTGGETWVQRDSAVGDWVRAAVFANDRWVAVGYHGQTAVSDDGDAWSFGVPALFDAFSGRPVARSGSVTVAAASDVTGWYPVVYRRVGAAPWQRAILVGLLPLTRIEPFGGGFLGLTSDGVASSPDGVSWTAHPLAAPSPGLEGLACSATRCVAVGKEIVTSEDGETWARNPLPGGGLAAHDVVWTGDRFVAIGHMPGGSTAMFLESADGLSWTLLTESGVEPPTALAAHGDRLVALRGGQGKIFTTDDGPPWEVIALPSHDNLLEVVWTGSFFAALGTKPDGMHLALWASVDGVAWHELSPPPETGYLGLGGFGADLDVFGAAGEIFSTTCNVPAVGRAPSRHLSAHR